MNQSDKEDQKSNISFQQVSWGLLAIVAVLFVVLNSDKAEINSPGVAKKTTKGLMPVATRAAGSCQEA